MWTWQKDLRCAPAGPDWSRARSPRFLGLLPRYSLWLVSDFSRCRGVAVQAQGRGPASVADIAVQLQNAVVNISTTQKMKDTKPVPVPEVPKGSPFEEYFQDFFDKEDRGGGGQRANSLGSGFVIDPKGFIVTNNHVIEGADEITAIFTDGSKLKVVEVVGRDAKTDLALLRVEPKVAADLGEAGRQHENARRRLGDGDRQSVWSWRHRYGRRHIRDPAGHQFRAV